MSIFPFKILHPRERDIHSLELRLEGVMCGFEGRQQNIEKLRAGNADIQLLELNQIHSNLCVKALPISDALSSADSFYTSDKEFGLVIKTADCLPLLGKCGPHIFAIHAGWRGLVAGVIDNLFNELTPHSDRFVCIGPHITQDSFEVGVDVLPIIHSFYQQMLENLNDNCLSKSLAAEFHEDQIFTAHPVHGKRYVNLQKLAILNLINLDFGLDKIYLSSVNTFVDKNWHSYRRDGASAGRNLSLVRFL